MIKVILIVLLTSVFECKAQKNDDTKIIITVPDSTDLYKATKIALVNSEFIVKDNYNMDTLTTYVRELESAPGYIVARAIIKGNKVTISGIYGIKKGGNVTDFGYSVNKGRYSDVAYFKHSMTWKTLMEVASQIKGVISYSK